MPIQHYSSVVGTRRAAIGWQTAVTLLFVLFAVGKVFGAGATYEQQLYDLGAFPVALLTEPYWTNGNPGKVYAKGDRVDVDGWLPPSRAELYLTDAEKTQYGIPKPALSYERYAALLDTDTY